MYTSKCNIVDYSSWNNNTSIDIFRRLRNTQAIYSEIRWRIEVVGKEEKCEIMIYGMQNRMDHKGERKKHRQRTIR
jgi:hypothetical protein